MYRAKSKKDLRWNILILWFVVFLSCVLYLPSVQARNQCADFESLFGPAEKITFNSVENRLSKNEFRVNRGVEGDNSYQEFLRTPQIPRLRVILDQVMQTGGRWLDMGAGMALAMRSMLQIHPSGSAQLFAASFRKPTLKIEMQKAIDQGITDLETHPDILQARDLEADLKKFNKNFRYVETGYVETAVKDKNSETYALRGSIDLITEVWGPLHYSGDIQAILNVYADLLAVGGKALIHFEEFHTEIWVNRQRVLLRDLVKMFPLLTGGRLKVQKTGMLFSNNNVASFTSSFFLIEKIKDGDEPNIPILKTSIIEDGQPPVRNVEVLDPKKWAQQLGLPIRIDREFEFEEVGYPGDNFNTINKFVYRTKDLLNDEPW
jgi:hypothetical protein